MIFDLRMIIIRKKKDTNKKRKNSKKRIEMETHLSKQKKSKLYYSKYFRALNNPKIKTHPNFEPC